MTDRFRIALAQLDPVMGDIPGNLARARTARQQAGAADVVLFSELFLVGYPPEDLVLAPALLAQVRAAIAALAADTATGPAVLIGAPWQVDGELYNAMLLLDGGHIVDVRLKHDLPNYDVFDEKRVFRAGPLPAPVTVRGVRLGVPVCEDIWTPAVTGALAACGAELLLVPNGSPFEAGKETQRLELARARVGETGLPLVYLNQVQAANYNGVKLRLWADGQEVEGQYIVAVATNIRHYLGGLSKLSPDACLDDNLLDLWLFSGKHLGDALRHAYEMMTGRHINSDVARKISFRSLRIEGESPFLIQTDGEPRGSAQQVNIHIKHGALKLLVPPRGMDLLKHK